MDRHKILLTGVRCKIRPQTSYKFWVLSPSCEAIAGYCEGLRRRKLLFRRGF
jgi:hypothetical protein